MGKRERATKDVKRLQLRREVIRVLADSSLARVQGGWRLQCTLSDCGASDSLCQPSKEGLVR